MKSYFAPTLAWMILLGAAYAQTSAGAQAQGSAAQNSSVSANPSGAQANSSSSSSVSGKAASGVNVPNRGRAETAAAGQMQSGSTVHAALTKPIDAGKNKPGDEVVAKTTQDVKSNGQVVIPRGSKIVGHITEAKARAKGQQDSSLGMAFDHAVLKNGTTVPVSFAVQAIGRSSAAAAEEDSFMSSAGGAAVSPSSASTVRSTGGGLVSGVGSTAGTVTNTAVGATGSTNGVGSVGAVGTAAAPLTASSQGMVGLPNLNLAASPVNSSSSMITSSKTNVHLDSGTEMILRANQ